MKTLHYQGFSKPCTCQYDIVDVNGKSCVLLVQGPLINTSITNMVEVLVSRILCHDLAGTNPSDIRVFEYYSPSLKPLRVWQEVFFEEHFQIKEDRGLLAKLLEAVVGTSETPTWGVDKPSWLPLEPGDVPAPIRNLTSV